MTEQTRQTLAAVLTACAVAIALLNRPLLQMDTLIWGPADPWNNGDFLGAHWLFWALSQPGDAAALLSWPWGEPSLISAFPNLLDAYLLGTIITSSDFPLGWNVMMVGHHLLNVSATVVLARAAGARGLHAAAAGALVAATPIMLHEHALGHTLTAAVWPGLFGLAALMAKRDIQAGLWIGLQGLVYLYTGLAVGLVALLVRPCRGLLTAILVMVPYLWLLVPQLEAASAMGPPDGYTSLAVDSLWGGSGQFHIRLQPLLGLGIAALFLGPKASGRARTRLLVAAVCLLAVALGPDIFLHRGEEPVSGSPLALIFQVPGLTRMHHPIRLAMLAVPLLAVASALAFHRRRSVWALSIIGLCGLNWKTIDNTAAWSASADIPGHDAGAWLADHASAVVDLGSDSMEALSLQTVHGKPILSGFHPRSQPRPGVDRSVYERLSRWSVGVHQPTLPARLKQLGYSHVVVVDRGPGKTPDATAVRSQLGPPVFPGVFAL